MKRTFIKIFTLAGLVAILSFCTCVSAKAAEKISVQIAPYYTEIDYMSVYNPGVEYPIFTYKSITYIPLTQHLANRLGMAVNFDCEKGLYIAKYNDMMYAQMPEDKPFGKDGTHCYWTDYTAVIPDYPIYVNGINYNSHKEEYPFFNYNGITYFPLTYHLSYEEMNLEIKFTPGEFYLNHANNSYSFADKFTAKNGDTIILNYRTGETLWYNEFEELEKMLYSWYNRYKLHTDTDFLEYLGTHDDISEFLDEYYRAETDDGNNENIYTVPGDEQGELNLFYKGEKIDTFKSAFGYFGWEYIFDNATFICANIITSNTPAPYTSHQEYVYIKTDKGTEKLPWDIRNNLARVIPDGKGGFYLCSDYYSPHYSSRWSTPFACVCHYTSDGKFYEVEIPGTNSVAGYAVSDGKLYVKAMKYSGDREQGSTIIFIDAMNSGFFALDVNTESSEKLYSYVYGDVFTTEDGGFYCIYSAGVNPRIINLINRRLIPIE